MTLDENAILKEIQSVFESDNENAIHDAIAYIHENGSVKMIPLLFDLLAKTEISTLKNDIFNCLADTKAPEATHFFIEALQDSRFVNEKNRILATLWQANLDFSDHIDLFFKILLNDNYETAIEALTIIEVCTEKLSDESKDKYKKELKNAMANEKSEKAALLQAAYQILE